MKSRLTRAFGCLLSAVGMLAISAPAAAIWLQGTVQDVRVIATGNPSDDKIVVFISASTGCTYNAFLLLATDPYFKESYSMLLSAKTTGMQV